ncbi:MAG TPA: hypothetical protein VML75_26190 [Kofleriaceae bacterium]|nr:hypothetical protein [Kofleriaceae bacterium]
MKILVLPEPSPWLQRAAFLSAAGEELIVLAPWAVSERLLRRLPARLRARFGHRALDGARSVPGWTGVDAALRAWAGSAAHRLIQARLARRRLVDHLAARMIRQLGSAVDAVIAPTLGSHRAFAAAPIAARRILVEDLPLLRELHRDLDRALAVHPSCAFLRRFRAPDSAIVRQETELALADELYTRSRYGAELHHARGRERSTVHPLRVPAVAASSAARADGPVLRPVIQLAGLAAARTGAVEALALLEHLPEVWLMARMGDGTEPTALLRHPRVIAPGSARADVVIAPAWCESVAPELERAVAAGVPVIATGAGAGWLEPHELAARLDRPSAPALIAAVTAALSPGAPGVPGAPR